MSGFPDTTCRPLSILSKGFLDTGAMIAPSFLPSMSLNAGKLFLTVQFRRVCQIGRIQVLASERSLVAFSIYKAGHSVDLDLNLRRGQSHPLSVRDSRVSRSCLSRCLVEPYTQLRDAFDLVGTLENFFFMSSANKVT